MITCASGSWNGHCAMLQTRCGSSLMQFSIRTVGAFTRRPRSGPWSSAEGCFRPWISQLMLGQQPRRDILLGPKQRARIPYDLRHKRGVRVLTSSATSRASTTAADAIQHSNTGCRTKSIIVTSSRPPRRRETTNPLSEKSEAAQVLTPAIHGQEGTPPRVILHCV